MAADGSRRYRPGVESTGRSEIRRRVDPFAEAVSDRGGDLDVMALSLSKVFQPDLDLIGALAALDELAAGCPTPTRDGVMNHLFGSGMFTGDRADYHHWRNSLLDQVVDARRGMPITLTVVGIEVARRVGVPLTGVGMPGHFLVGDAEDPTWFADPFHGRTGLTGVDCREMLVQMGMSRWSERFLDPVPNRLIIARILNNLKSSSERRGDRLRLALVMQARQVLPEFSAEGDDARQALAIFN
jgi:regulator of sirC expression with transglutaminase-like and TPR domain